MLKIDRELAYASIYVSAIEGSSRSKEILSGFQSANSFIRKLLSERIELRSFPRLRFYWDPTPERADRIEQLFAQMHEEDKENDQNQSTQE